MGPRGVAGAVLGGEPCLHRSGCLLIVRPTLSPSAITVQPTAYPLRHLEMLEAWRSSALKPSPGWRRTRLVQRRPRTPTAGAPSSHRRTPLPSQPSCSVVVETSGVHSRVCRAPARTWPPQPVPLGEQRLTRSGSTALMSKGSAVFLRGADQLLPRVAWYASVIHGSLRETNPAPLSRPTRA